MKIKILIITIFAALFMVACIDDEDGIYNANTNTNKDCNVYIKLVNPVNIPDKADLDLSKGILTIENLNTGEIKKSKYSLQTSFELESGLYNIKFEKGKISYTSTLEKNIPVLNPDKTPVIDSITNEPLIEKQTVTENVENKLQGYSENIEVIDDNINVDIPLFMSNPNAGKGFIISEIFFARTTTPEGKPYIAGDPFIEIYNNSNEVLYADGLCFGETSYIIQTVDKKVGFIPDYREEKIAVEDVYRVPGSGTDHPVQPGKTFVICDIAIDHTKVNTNSVDLSKADFEWFDGVEAEDADVPGVPNLESVIKKTSGSWNPNVNGCNSFILFRIPKDMTPEAFMQETAFHFRWFFKQGKYEVIMEEDSFGVTNDKIIDAVQCSKPSWFQWTIMNRSLDLSWTYAVENEAYNGLSVKRKISYKDGDRFILQDTNDSANDFIPSAPNPSPGRVDDHKNY